MPSQPILTDRAALAAHRRRADGGAWLLHEEAIDEMFAKVMASYRAFSEAYDEYRALSALD